VTMHAALAGIGIATMPFYHVRHCVESGLAKVVLDDFTLAPIPAYAVWPSGARPPSRVRRFIDLLTRQPKTELI
jgi:DNA-binding transcriptional LysR family regulator